MNRTDVTIDTVDGKKLTVLGLLDEMRERSRIFEADSFPQAVLNRRFMSGNQFYELKDRQVVQANWPEYIPRVQRNLMRNLGLTYAARVTKDRRSTMAWPNEAGPNDPRAAQVANQLLSYYRQKIDRDVLVSRAAWTAQPDSCISFFVYWDPESGASIDVDGVRHPQGDVKIDLVSIFDYGTDGSELVEDSEWCFRRKFISEHDARARMRAAGIKEDPQVESYATVYGIMQSGVEAFELWYRPTPTRIPDGMFALVVSGHVVAHDPTYPYAHKELPLAVWKIGDKDKHPHGETHVTDVVPEQHALNKLLSAIALVTSRVAMGYKALAFEAQANVWENGSQILTVSSAEEAAAIRWIAPPPPPALLFAQVEERTAAINGAFGINEAVASGGTPQSTKSARQLAYISELDGQKLTMARNNLDHTLLRVDRQLLRLVQQYVSAERVVRILGPQGTFDEVVFRGADIMGVDVHLEPTSGNEQLRAAKVANAEESAAAGYVDQATASELRQTGLDETRYTAMQRIAVQQLISGALAGGDAQADPTIDPDIATGEIEFALQQYANMGPQRLISLQELLRQYQELASQAASEQTQGSPDLGVTPQPEQGIPS